VSDIDGNLTADQLRASQAEAARWRRDFEAASDNVHVLVSSYVRQMDVRNRLQSALEECSRLATEPSDDKDMQLAGITRECQRALQDLSPQQSPTHDIECQHPDELALIVHTHAGAVRICRRCAESVCVPYGQGREAANG
jgi:hypothetical protein